MTSSGLSPEQRRLLEQLLDAETTRPASQYPPRPGDPRRAPLTSDQERILLLEEWEPASARYVLAATIGFAGPIDTRRFADAVAAVVDRHEALRTGIVVDADGTAFQTIAAPGSAPHVEVHPAAAVDEVVASLVGTPFDLARPPLVRAAILDAGAGAPHRAVVAVHHAVADAVSLEIVLRDLLAHYRGDALSPVAPVRYADIAYWSTARRAEAATTHGRYWQHTMADAGAPVVRADRSVPDSDRRPVPFRLDADVVELLRTAAGAGGPFAVLLAGYATVLNRWAGERDVVVAVPTSLRRTADVQDVVGFLVGTLPVRIPLHRREPFARTVARTQQTVLDALTHELPLADVLHAVAPTDRATLGSLRYALTYTDVAAAPLPPGVTVEPIAAAAKFDLELHAAPEPDGGVHGWFEFDPRALDRGTVLRVAASLAGLLRAAADAPQTPTGRLPLAASVELAAVLETAMSAAALAVDSPPVLQRLQEVAADRPHSPALVDDGTAEVVTYALLLERARRAGSALLARGVRPGDVVAVQLPRGPELVVALLGIQAAGAVPLPIDAEQPLARRDQVVADSAAVLLVADPATVAGLADHEGPLAPLPARRPADPAYVLYTSGSTGRPKGVVNTHGGLANRLAWMQARYPIGPGDVVLQKTSVGFDVSVWELYWPLVTGATLVLAAPGRHRDPTYLWDVLRRHDVSTCHFVPSMLAAFLDARPAEPAPRRLARVFSSGEELTAHLAARFVELLPGTTLHNLYGPTEAAIDVTAHDVTAHDVTAHDVTAHDVTAHDVTAHDVTDVTDVDRGGGVPIGRPTTGNAAIVLDDDLGPCPTGVVGQLHLGGGQLAQGYLHRPGLTAARFVPSPVPLPGPAGGPGARLYATGDRVRLLASGELEYLGRADEQVKIRGNRVEPGEAAAALRGAPGVADARVVVRRDVRGPRLVGFVVAARPGDDPAGGARAWVAQRLPGYLVPAAVLTVVSWPVTASGKLDVAALPDDEAGTTGSGNAPQTATELAVAELWAELLGRPADAFGLEDDFFDVGGDSLAAGYLARRLAARLDAPVALRDVMAHPRLGELAARAETARSGPAAAERPIVAVDRARYHRPDPDPVPPCPRVVPPGAAADPGRTDTVDRSTP
ncbi:amino acid adenylation domain-containing protein [Jatrophihabitans endophyticus]|uniref:Amino acid adenylation domain-containing protein n=1 Tax=Jatrophihabitans endophyticus TaxID=1206085 RepID=A0A1M5CP43_9ACTN|nr:non-ribosomal peptide synthetase [Jatrophihabitans endophyticus]SHF56426.1 amino acid adenylation domain-containing protein [Jatrophihabitans endophyticus]